MNLHYFPLAWLLFGISIFASSFVRWFIIYQDLSSLLFGCAVGGLVCLIAWIYNWMKETDATLRNHYYRLEAMAAQVFNVQDDHIRNEAQGGLE